MEWILIVFFGLGSNGGVSVTYVQNFTSQDSCQMAAKAILDRKTFGSYLNTACIEKR